MKISLITACRNSATVIRSAMERVLAQKGVGLEYLVIDGGSDDGTVDALKEYAPKFDGRMRWISERDEGMYDAINKGIRMATGDVVGILNADDCLDGDDVLARIAEAFGQKKDCGNEDERLDCVFGNVRFVKEGAGTYVASASESYSGGISVVGGTYKLSNYAAGDIHIGSGATFDQYGYSLSANSVVLAGGTLTNTKGAKKSELPSRLDLIADSSIVYGKSVTFDWGVPKNSVWNLGGKTLNLVMDGGDPDFNMAEGEILSNGTFKVTVNASAGGNKGKGWVAFAALDGRDGLNLDLGTSILRLKHCSPNKNSKVCDFTCNPLAGQTVYSGNKLEIYGTFTPQSTDGFNLLMMDGSAIDLSSWNGVWNCAFANSGGYAGGSDTGCKVAFADGATVTVNLAGRADLDSIAEARGYIVNWAANAVPADSVTFVLDATTAGLPQGYSLRKDSTGLKLTKKTGMVVIIR